VTGIHPITKAYVKQSLGTTSWEAGAKVVAQMEVGVVTDLDCEKITVAHAINTWVEKQQWRGIASTTIDAYRGLERKILKYTNEHGIIRLKQFRFAECEAMVESWKLSAVTIQQNISHLRNIFKLAIVKGWITENPALNCKAPRVVHKQVEPYTPEQEVRVYDALDHWADNIRIRDGQWSLRPTTLKCLVFVLRDTGLRISDAIRVHPNMVEIQSDGSGVLTIKQHKVDYREDPGAYVTVYLLPETVQMLRRVPPISSRYPFMQECPAETDASLTPVERRNRFKEHVRREARLVYAALQVVGKVAGVGEVRAHRFRHTLAVTKLTTVDAQGNNQWDIQEVARLLGHMNSEITERHYAKWTQSRQHRLQEKTRQQWEREGKIVPIRPIRSA
jgi:integrase